MANSLVGMRVRPSIVTVGRATWQLCWAIGLAFVLGLVVAQPVWAAEFTVDTVLDGVDSNPGDGLCLNITVVPGGACTLRAAIQEANTTAEPDTIILPAGVYTLTLENLGNFPEDAAETGDLDITTNIVIEGAGASVTVVAASDDLNDRVFHLLGENAVVAMNRLAIRNGNTTGLAAGTRDGGGILVGGGKLDAFEIAVSDSESPTFGGGIMFIGVNNSFLHRCTIHGNRAVGTNGRGGGIFHGQNYRLSLANCTVSDNEAESRGGGIDVSNNSQLIIIHNSTVANNRLLDDPEEGAGIYIGNNTDIYIYSSIVADNFAQGNVANDCYGQIDILDYSLIEVPAPDNDCIIAGDGESVESLLGADDPRLGPLADNGGELLTHLLLEGSIAIDAGSQLSAGSGGRACYATDARGQARPGRVYCDMGAVELPQYLFVPKIVVEP
jgi:CSLREA domain-containing protein